jgi:hypothetical protein
LNNYKDYSGHRSYELAYKDDYAVDIRISVFKENTEEVIKIVLRQAFPTDIGDIQLNWNDTNDYMRIPVSFTYTDWYIILCDMKIGRKKWQQPKPS